MKKTIITLSNLTAGRIFRLPRDKLYKKTYVKTKQTYVVMDSNHNLRHEDCFYEACVCMDMLTGNIVIMPQDTEIECIQFSE